ncbi:RNA polymerase sigma factor [Methylomonas sp. CM2]|uniref:RNA polymerase sigma factor n=1 Tax=Methylomonas sp. CM2 TaxID=3417647 RepID=UPI003CF98F37
MRENSRIHSTQTPQRMNDLARHRVQCLIETHQKDLQAMLRRRLDCPQDAADVAQEAYRRLLKIIPAQDIQSPKALLFHIAGQLAVNVLNRRAWHDAKHDGDAALEEQTSRDHNPEQQLSLSQTQAVIRAAIDSMPPRRREAFVLHRFHHLTYPQIADILGISVAMVEKHVSAGLLTCRQHLHDAGLLEP